MTIFEYVDLLTFASSKFGAIVTAFFNYGTHIVSSFTVRQSFDSPRSVALKTLVVYKRQSDPVLRVKVQICSIEQSRGMQSVSSMSGNYTNNIYVPSLKTSTLPIHEFYVIVDLSGNCCKLICFIMGFECHP